MVYDQEFDEESKITTKYSVIILKRDEIFSDDEAREMFFLPENGIYEIYPSQTNFAKRFKMLFDLFDKALFTIAALCWSTESQEYLEIINAIKEKIPEFVDFKYEMKAKTEDADPSIDFDAYFGEGNYFFYRDKVVGTRYDFGDIDGLDLRKFLEERHISIREFLLNKKYCVMIHDSNNHTYQNMRKARLIDLSKIEFDGYDENNEPIPYE